MFLQVKRLSQQCAIAVAVILGAQFPAPGYQAEDAQQLVEEARAAQAQGETALAARKFRALLATHPDEVANVEKIADQYGGSQPAVADFYLIAGRTRFGMGQYDLAGRDAARAMHLDPKLRGLATLRGMILEQTADYDGALAMLQQAIAANPNDYDAQFYLGAIYYFKRDMAKAQMHLARALQLQPTSVQARYELALVARADGHLEIALKQLQEVVKDLPDWLQPHVELSALYYKLGRAEDGAKERKTVDQMMAVMQQNAAQAAR